MQTVDTKITLAEVNELAKEAREERISRRLDRIYQQVPANPCERCAKCCFNGAQVHPIEFLNIYDVLLGMPELTQVRLAKRLVEYELLHMTTLDLSCAFLEGDECIIYERMPLQCRLFGLYPKRDYEVTQEKSRSANEQLAMYYARNNRVLLPEQVMLYDVEQCSNNIQEDGKAIVVGERERQHLHAQVYALGEQFLPDEWLSPDEGGFASQYAEMFFDTDDLEELKVTAIKEYQSSGKRKKLDKILSTSGLRF